MNITNVQKTSGLKRLFPLLANENINMKREIMAGITTFLTMAYIIAVNPNILSKTGMNAGVLVTATCFSAALGVSTVTTYVESSTGVIAGGRTGWTAITTGFLFLMSMFFSPIFISIPGCATAPALIYVGYLMLSSVKNIDLHDILEVSHLSLQLQRWL